MDDSYARGNKRERNTTSAALGFLFDELSFGVLQGAAMPGNRSFVPYDLGAELIDALGQRMHGPLPDTPS